MSDDGMSERSHANGDDDVGGTGVGAVGGGSDLRVDFDEHGGVAVDDPLPHITLRPRSMNIA